MMINKFLIYCVMSSSGMVHGAGITKESAWKEASNTSGITKNGLIDEGFSISIGVVLDWGKFKEIIN